MWASSSYILPRRATPETCPLSGTHSLSIGHPSTLRWALVHPPLGTRPGVHLPCSPSRYRGPPWSLRWATPSGHSKIKFFSSTSLLTEVFIHFPESSSTDYKNASTFQKINQLLRNFILCREISSSVQKVHLLHSKFILCLPNSSTMPFLE
jgi:hypothetical protein